MLINAINLIFPDNSVPPPTLTTDASIFAAGAQLDQFLDGHWRPQGLWSKAFNPSQKLYIRYRRGFWWLNSLGSIWNRKLRVEIFPSILTPSSSLNTSNTTLWLFMVLIKLALSCSLWPPRLKYCPFVIIQRLLGICSGRVQVSSIGCDWSRGSPQVNFIQVWTDLYNRKWPYASI